MGSNNAKPMNVADAARIWAVMFGNRFEVGHHELLAAFGCREYDEFCGLMNTMSWPIKTTCSVTTPRYAPADSKSGQNFWKMVKEHVAWLKGVARSRTAERILGGD